MAQVVVLAHGGLGNQLFQYAAARSLDDHPMVLSYAGAWGAGHPSLADFGIQVAYPNRLARTRYPGIVMRESWRDDVSAVVARGWGGLRGIRAVEQAHPFDEGTVPPARLLVMTGYYQHPRWWGPSWRSVAAELATQAPAGLGEYRETQPVVVKLRRSDYLELGWGLSREWLRSALARANVRDRSVVVAAEDREGHEFANSVLEDFGCTLARVPAFTGNPNFDDFWAIAGARTIISANSSYSWWASAVAMVLSKDAVSVTYPHPWLPNRWSDEPLPSFGIPGWHAEETDFALRRP